MDQDRAADFVRRFAEFWQAPAVERLDTVLPPDARLAAPMVSTTYGLEAGAKLEPAELRQTRRARHHSERQATPETRIDPCAGTKARTRLDLQRAGSITSTRLRLVRLESPLADLCVNRRGVCARTTVRNNKRA